MCQRFASDTNPCPSPTPTSPPTWNGWASCGPPGWCCPRRRWSARGRYSTGGTPRGSGACRPAWRKGKARRRPRRNPACRIFAPSPNPCWTGAFPQGATPARRKRHCRRSWKRLRRTAARFCGPTSRCAPAQPPPAPSRRPTRPMRSGKQGRSTPWAKLPLGNCWSASAPLARTLTAPPKAGANRGL